MMTASIQRMLRCFENPGALLAITVAALISLGIVMVFSASGARAGSENTRVAERAGVLHEDDTRSHHGSGYFVKQTMWAGIGIGLGLLMLGVPIEKIERYALPILIASVVMLLLVSFTPLGVTAKGARRWIGVGSFTLQPAEFAKIGLVIFMARFMADRREKMHDLWHGFLPSAAILAGFCVLIMLQKDLGTIVLSGSVVLGMWCLAQVRMRHLATIVLAAVPVLIYLVFQHSYRIRRVLAFMYPEEYADSEAYQLNQSLIAVGSSGTFGPGLGEGLQKYHYLVESHTDFIFAIVAEELGLVGAVSVCLLFVSYILLGFWISYKAPDYFSGLMAAGLTLIVGCAAFINLFVVLGMAPTKGLALPFLSYGGSSLLASMVCTGLLINIANYSLQVRGVKEVC